MTDAASASDRTARPSVPADAWRMLHEGAVLAPLPGVGGLRVTGDDRLDFLHGQLAADVRGLPEGGARRSLLLDAKGHARAEATVHRRSDDLYLAVEDGAAAWVAARLRAHVIFDAVEIDDLGEALRTVTVQGPAVLAVFASLGWPVPEGQAFATVPFAGASLLLTRRARSVPGGIDVHGLRRDLEAVDEALRGAGALAVREAALEPSRIAAGLPRAGREAGEGVLPQEAGLEDAFSTRKGCYLGQEIMARIEARGRIKRGLAGLAFEGEVHPEGPVLASGASLRLDGRRVGRVGGAAYHPEFGAIGLGVLRHDAGEDAELEVEGRPALRARRVPLPFRTASFGR